MLVPQLRSQILLNRPVTNPSAGATPTATPIPVEPSTNAGSLPPRNLFKEPSNPKISATVTTLTPSEFRRYAFNGGGDASSWEVKKNLTAFITTYGLTDY